MSTQPPSPIPETLEARLDKLVYLYVYQADGASIREIQDALDESQLDLYPAVDRLVDRDLVVSQGDDVRPVPRDESTRSGRDNK